MKLKHEKTLRTSMRQWSEKLSVWEMTQWFHSILIMGDTFSTWCKRRKEVEGSPGLWVSADILSHFTLSQKVHEVREIHTLKVEANTYRHPGIGWQMWWGIYTNLERVWAYRLNHQIIVIDGLSCGTDAQKERLAKRVRLECKWKSQSNPAHRHRNSRNPHKIPLLPPSLSPISHTPITIRNIHERS